MYWQISVTITSFGDHGGGERNGSQNLCTIVMTHNDLCTCIALTKWDGPVACVNVTENVENFQSKCYHFTATKTSVTVSVKQYEHDRVTRCTFSVDFKEIKTISQSLPSTCAICLQPRQSGRHRWEIGTHRISGTMNFRIRIQRYFFLRCMAYQTGTYELTYKSAQS